MSEPDEVFFACHGCGTYNPAKARGCSGCGRWLAEPADRRRGVFESFGNFPIGSMLVWIALVALCMMAGRIHIGLGLLASVTLLPSTIRTSIVARTRWTEGLPMSPSDRIELFLMTMLVSLGIGFVNIFAIVTAWNITQYWFPTLIVGLFTVTISVLAITLDRRAFNSNGKTR